jgi:uncharacterized Rmd1/YagE family protein
LSGGSICEGGDSRIVSNPFDNRTEITARALFLGQRIDLREFEKGQVLARGPLLVSAGAAGYAVLFRYGVIVLFGLDAGAEADYLADIRPLVTEPFAKIECEEAKLVAVSDESEGVIDSRILLREFDFLRLQLVADVLSKSVVLAYYESAIAESFDLVEPLAKTLQAGVSRGQVRELIRHIGNTLSIQGKMVGRAEITEKPELLWEQPQHERLFVRLENAYELRERFEAQERKLALISRTAETLLGLLQEKRTLRVEWYIVILIVFEILLTLYEMWHKA